jgi:hypothetical protein
MATGLDRKKVFRQATLATTEGSRRLAIKTLTRMIHQENGEDIETTRNLLRFVGIQLTTPLKKDARV